MHLTALLLPLTILLLTHSASANWLHGREHTSNSTTTATNTTTPETLGFNNSTNVCANTTARAECCDAVPAAANCPVPEGRDNTSTYDAGAPLVDDLRGGASVTASAAVAGATGGSGTFVQGNSAGEMRGGAWAAVVVAGVVVGGAW